MWFDIVKTGYSGRRQKPSHPREYKTYQGNRPHFYQYLTRAFRPASEQTPQYLERKYGWDELDDFKKEMIKQVFEQYHPKNHPDWPEKNSPYSSNPIPGIKVDWDGLEPTLDEVYYNEWRDSKKGGHSEKPGWGHGTYEQGRLYRILKATLVRREVY